MLPKNEARPRKRAAIAILTFLLALPSAPRATAAAQTKTESSLKIVILEGEGAINNLRQRTAREPIVQVEDQNRKPVAGALVLFTLPDNGPGVVFADGSRSAVLHTDAKGQAAARGLKPTQSAGNFQIKVSASYQGLTTTAVINQSNVAVKAAALSSGKILAVVGAVGAAAAAGIVVSQRKKDSPPGPTSTNVQLGAPTVGRP